MTYFKRYGVLYAVLFVVVTWLLTPSLVNWLAPTGNDSIASRGQFGDMYGFVTSLFSGLTIIGLVYTIIQQHEDLRIARESLAEQKKELQLNRDELKETREEYKKQHDTLKLQRFESTFFRLLELNLSIIDEIKTYSFDKINGATEPFLVFNASEGQVYRNFKNINPSDRDKVLPFGSSMFEFLKLICALEIEEEREKYLSIVFSQLRNREKLFLFYYFNIESHHPNYELFEIKLIDTIYSDDKVQEAKGIFKEWIKARANSKPIVIDLNKLMKTKPLKE